MSLSPDENFALRTPRQGRAGSRSDDRRDLVPGEDAAAAEREQRLTMLVIGVSCVLLALVVLVAVATPWFGELVNLLGRAIGSESSAGP